MTNSLILHAQGTGEGVPLPLVLAGYPAEIEGKPVTYRRKEIIRAGEWVHRGTRQPFSITRERMDQWAASFNKRLSAGIKPFVPDHHTDDPKAKDNHGFVVGLNREGDSLYADLQLIGAEAMDLIAKNDVSVYVKADGIDARGNPSGEFLHHVALTPDPNQPHLGPYVTLAASAGGSAVDVPIYEPATAPTKELPMLKPETLTALRTKLGLKPEATDAEVAEQAASLALNPPADPQVVALSASVQTLTTERDTFKADAERATLALSANSPATDPLVLSMFGETFEAKAETAIENGVPKAAVDYFAGLCRNADGSPAALALSACTVPAGEGKTKATRLGIAVMDGLTKFAKGMFGTGVALGQVAPANLLCLSSADPNVQTPEQIKAAVDANLAQTDLGRRVLAARKAG
jgi:hypothetical protein